MIACLPLNPRFARSNPAKILWHVKEYEYERDTSYVKFSAKVFLLSNCMSLPESSGGQIGNE